MIYRAEIDGLRAVAVLPVILYHAGFVSFAGGFVGVDVFFVISGFLITSVILADLEKGRFSLWMFYERRARRILPALFLVMAACLPFVWRWLLPVEIEQFMESTIATVLFLSNFLLWEQSGYFDTGAELKPLLHTWSLAVEEQFYILFPLILIATWRRAREILFSVISFFLVASFAISVLWVSEYPAAAFFLLPSRAWELLAGSLTALALVRYGLIRSPAINQFGATIGLILIVLAIALFDAETPFPGLNAVPPVLGTVLILFFAHPGTVVHYALSLRLPVAIGLISYSAYLFHQPIFALARHRFGEIQPPGVMIALTVVILPLAWLSWRFVERPFRDRTAISARRMGFILTSAAGLLLAIGIKGDQSDGFEELLIAQRMTQKQQAIYLDLTREAVWTVDQFDYGDCLFGATAGHLLAQDRLADCEKQHGPGLLVVGDSHALDLFNMIAKSEWRPFVVVVADGGCRPHGKGRECFIDKIAGVPTKLGHTISHIIFHQSGSHLLRDVDGRPDSQAIFDRPGFMIDAGAIGQVTAYLTELAAEVTAQVIWVGPFIEYRRNPLDALLDPSHLPLHPRTEIVFEALEDSLVDALPTGSDVRYVPFAKLYDVPAIALEDGCFHFSDGDHFSSCGEAAAARSASLRAFLKTLD